jgi:hypothetical protein
MQPVMSADRVFIVAPVSQVRGAVVDPAAWQHWWPSWQVRISEDRGQLGARLHITAPWPGTSELYLEAHRDGVIVHYFLRLPAVGPRGLRQVEVHRRATVAALTGIKDELEAPGRAAARRVVV